MGLFIPFNLPAGSVTQYAGATAPDGWLFMYGQAVSRTTYKALFDAIGVAFGAGDGSTTFNLPDARGRILFGKDNMGGVAANRLTTAGGGVDGATLGAAGGSEGITLTSGEMPSHTHTQNAHTHDQTKSGNGAGGSSPIGTTGSGSIPTAMGVATQSTTPTNNNTGTGGAHKNIPPALVINYIIKT